ncbi:hypothetical protein SAMN05444166_6284 [Singulisphaera sp. GP187]|uniref:hypothetical protein n=1 Tax=Singulisphaera sp. GP187 TaxID=1882752 RepID=UPI00092A4DFB|nr:hypothetical protein [Singulisphaera sp. GP187]SIO60147.1 hypothetical protein SAMN05444166_6284 [Singulisphaera sp. GP187]
MNIDGLQTGLTIYAVIRDSANRVYNGTAFVTPYVVADLASYAIPLPETPAGSGNYACPFPLGSPAGNYRWTLFEKPGGNPAVGDPVVGRGSDYWDGTGLGIGPLVAAVHEMLSAYNELLNAGTVSGSSSTTTRFTAASGLSTASGFYTGRQVCFTSGQLQGLKTVATNYAGTTKTFTVSPPLPFAPANGDTFNII